MPAVFVVASGPPGSGKSTLAGRLAPAVGLPLVAKDTIKEALMSVLPVPDVGASAALGRASIVVMFAVAAQAPRGEVLDCNFRRSLARADLHRLPGQVVEVFCRCPHAAAVARYRNRQRAEGHFDAVRSPDDLWNADTAEPVAGGWPVLEADTDGPVDLAAVVAFVRAR